jgi:putative peptidoglycan binding protein
VENRASGPATLQEVSEATAQDSSETVPPDTDHGAALARVREGFDLPVDQNYTLVVEPWEVLGCGAIPGTVFRFGNAFPLPPIGESLSEVEELVTELGSEGKLLLFGHSDSAASDPQGASERRAKAVHTLLVNDPAGFQAVDDEESWEINVVQSCLTKVGYRPGPVDNADGPQTQAAVKAFQEDQGLDVDGIAGPLTRRALYTEYLNLLSPGLEAAAFLDPATLGCADTHPVIETGESCEDNRRVTTFVFKASRPPLVPGCHDAGGEWYGKIADACACGARGPAPTPTTLRANGPRTTFRPMPADLGPPFEEFVSLGIVHPGGGAPPAQVLGASKVRLRAETDPPTEGSFTWTCETEGVTLESEGANASLDLGDDPPAEVSLRCSFVSQAGNTFEAEHALTTGFAFRYQHPEGEVTETPPRGGGARGTGEDEDSESYLEYSGDPLDTIFDIHQDQGDGDCGPTCAAFFRFGGARASGTPTENGRQVTGGLIQGLAERMRAETNASANHQEGTSRQEMCQILREFAGSHGGRRRAFEVVNETYDLSTEPAILLAAGSWGSWLQRLLRTSPRGILTGVQSYPKAQPYREAIREADALGTTVSYTNHWVVVIGATSQEVVFYDPGFGQHGRHTFPLLDLFAAHMEWAKGPILNRAAMSSHLIVAQDPDPEWQLLAGRGICEVDAGLMTFGDRLVAQRDAEWFSNPDEADSRARAISGGGKSAVVVEVPHGNFAVVEVNDVGGDNARQPTPDRADSESDDVLRRLPGALGSVRFFLRAGGNVHLTQVRYRGSHRKE